LCNQCVFDWQEESWPGDGGAQNADSVARVAFFAVVFGPFETPVNGAEEREDLRCKIRDVNASRSAKKS
jgi:hypothetical protein